MKNAQGVRVRVSGTAALLTVALLAGCAKSGIEPISSGERYVSTERFEERYLLGPGDQVRVIVFNEPQLSGQFAIGTNGEISLPLIGSLVVAGKTVAEASDLVRAEFSQGYLRDPRISMQIDTYRPFFILGEVGQPGQYPFATGMTALNAIATAKGFTPRAKRNVVMIRRFGEQYEQPYVLTPDLRVWPGDTLRLTERFF
ncbi:polysaccharide biosynthesis/export family protein [Sphingomonas sp. R647]|uniref:polysaccharide biosynthesis/export family protein n=1 Tax=Sphingomonas sp. R647 TaxID=2875233 RepID=UPI001CD4330D|nr:polysaccharide biosynthesis/export family protein [Sphingomonas sp. R647]